MVQFHHLCEVEEQLYNSSLMSVSRQADIPALTASEEQAVFTYTKFLARHQVEFVFNSLITELLFQIQMAWGVTIQPDDVCLVWQDRHGCVMNVHKEQSVLEALDMHRPHSHSEQDRGSLLLPRAFTDRNQPYVFRMDYRKSLQHTYAAITLRSKTGAAA